MAEDMSVFEEQFGDAEVELVDIGEYRDDLWWLSFVDDARPKGNQLLGVALVQLPEPGGLVDAVRTAWADDCNPGGEVVGITIPEERRDLFDGMPRNTLLSKQEAAPWL